jgi:hypothetical protein
MVRIVERRVGAESGECEDEGWEMWVWRRVRMT